MKIETTKINKPPTVVIYGAHGVGKSTFAASAPSPIFIRTEDRHGHLRVQAFEFMRTLQMVRDAINYLRTEDHQYKTVVLDSLDWTQDLIYQELVEKYGAKNISDKKKFAFGLGFQLAEEIWTSEVLKPLVALAEERKMIPILISHFKERYIEDAEGNQYKKYDIDLQDRACARVHEMADVVGFMDYRRDSEEKEAKGGGTFTKISSTGKVVLRLQPQPFFEAKRYGDLPAALEIPRENGWAVFSEALKIALQKV